MDSSKSPNIYGSNKQNFSDFSSFLNNALHKQSAFLDFEDKGSGNRTSGRWSKEEHHRFIEGLTKYGKNWKKVEEHIGTRTGAQIRSHAQKFFIRLTKEFKKRMEKDQRGSNTAENGHEEINKKNCNRLRSDSVISNFSNFSIDNISENEEEEKMNNNSKDLSIVTSKSNNSNPKENTDIKETEKQKSQQIEKEIILQKEKEDFNPEKPSASSTNNNNNLAGLDKFLSNFSEKQEDVKNKLLKSQENNELLKIPTYEKQLSNYQGIIKFFQGLHSYYENSTLAQQSEHHGFLEFNEIKQNQSFFEFIFKTLEKYVNKSSNPNSSGCSPIRIRKLSDLVVMPINQKEEGPALNGPFLKDNKLISPMKADIGNCNRIRKNSFNLCNENESESKKLENLKRKTILKDVLEKKTKI